MGVIDVPTLGDMVASLIPCIYEIINFDHKFRNIIFCLTNTLMGYQKKKKTH